MAKTNTARKKKARKAPPRVIIEDRVYIPANMVDEETLDKHYCYEFEVKQTGRAQDHTMEVVRLWTEETRKGHDYFAVPKGDLRKVRTKLGVNLSTALDKRADVDLSVKLKWTGNLYTGKIVNGNKTTNQKKLVAKWLKKKFGIIEARPRSGKTVLGTYITCDLQKRTLIVADQEDLLRNFLKSFHDNTNIKALEKKAGRPLIGIARNMRELDRFEIALVTYQKFIRESGDERLRAHVLKKFGFVICDEIHGGGATSFARFLNRMDARYLLGLTATPARKDGRYKIVQDIAGPVTARSKNVSLVPKIEVVETGIGPKRGYKHWTYAMKFLAENEERNKLIVRNIFKDLRAGHRCVLVPVERKEHMDTLVEMINRQAKFNRVKKGESLKEWPKETAVPFWAKSPRQETLDRIDSGEVRVVIAIRKLIRQGVNVLLPSMMHVVIPVSAGKDVATGSPLFQQLSNRVCTPYLNKPQPVVKLYIDRMDQSVGCFRSLFSKEILPRLKDKPKNPANYKIGRQSYERAINIVKDGTRSYRYQAGGTSQSSGMIRW